MPGWTVIVLLVCAAWIGWAWACALAARAEVRGGVMSGVATLATRVYARLWQRLRVEGGEHAVHAAGLVASGRPLIIVANHTAGVDPLLIQSALPVFVRWMMMRQMMLPALSGLWDWLEIIAVGPGDPASARTALAHLKSVDERGRGGVLGVFPEGGIERPPGRLLAFQAGVGLIVKRSGAPVLLATIDGAAAPGSTLASLLLPGRARVRLLGVVEYSQSGLDAQAIADDLRARIGASLGWPA
jgi:1-acyl-sn-glycerol-3-phosphate acyltransferase